MVFEFIESNGHLDLRNAFNSVFELKSIADICQLTDASEYPLPERTHLLGKIRFNLEDTRIK